MDATPGLRIADRYEMKRRLGDGGMGSVWLAHDLVRRTDVAVKLVMPLLVDDPETLERFRRETAIGASFEHPHMVRVLGDGVLRNGSPYLVMEHVPGEDLGARIRRWKRLSVGETRAIVTQAASALRAMHERGVVHRDIKPANILLDERGGGLTIKLADFGLAREESSPSLTQVNAVVGTPTYMSPERIGDGESSPRADLWSLAAVAYHCLTGRPPFDATTFAAVCMAIGQGKVPPVTSLVPELGPALDAWFARALHTRPGNRFASAEEHGATFAAACAGAMPPSVIAARVKSALAPALSLLTRALGAQDPAPVPAGP